MYADAYRSLCRHRRFESFTLTEELDTASFTVYDFDSVQSSLTIIHPSEADVAEYLARAKAAFADPESVSKNSWLDV